MRADTKTNLFTFNGPAYVPAQDQARLSNQFTTIRDLMSDGAFRTLKEIETATGYPQASISAQLRHAKKKRFGGHQLNRKSLGGGLHSYQLVISNGEVE